MPTRQLMTELSSQASALPMFIYHFVYENAVIVIFVLILASRRPSGLLILPL